MMSRMREEAEVQEKLRRTAGKDRRNEVLEPEERIVTECESRDKTITKERETKEKHRKEEEQWEANERTVLQVDTNTRTEG